MVSNTKKNAKTKTSKQKLSEDEYLALKDRSRYESKVKDSKFIATAEKVNSEEQAIAFINEMKKEFHDATHNCSAYTFKIQEKSINRFNDDGEPSGSAGRPILQAIESKNLSNTCVVVTRYFGGTKLGTGGLARAYGGAATQMLEKAEIEKVQLTQVVTFTVSFDFISVVHNIVGNFKGTMSETQFDDNVTFTVDIRKSKYNSFKEKLIEATNGQVKF
jgi:uncharacterized YigZ family protein